MMILCASCRLLALCLAFVAFSVSAATYTGTVTVVRDGDTVQVTTDQGEKVELRLQAIDAPEKGQKKRPGQPFAEQSRDMLNRLALSKRVTVETIDTDRYGLQVGLLRVETGDGSIDVGLLQLQMGLAWTFPRYLPQLPDYLRESYRYAEAIARTKRRGLWADAKPQAPWDWRPSDRRVNSKTKKSPRVKSKQPGHKL